MLTPSNFKVLHWIWFALAIYYFFGANDSAAGIACLVYAELMVIHARLPSSFTY